MLTLKVGDLPRDCLKDADKVLRDIRIPETKHDNASLIQPTRPSSISHLVLCKGVLSAIKLDRKPQSRTIKVQDVSACRVLAAKIEPELLVPQLLPKAILNIGRITPKAARMRCLFDRSIEAA